MTQREILTLIEERGLRVERYGLGWRVVGPGVDILVRDLSVLTRADLV